MKLPQRILNIVIILSYFLAGCQSSPPHKGALPRDSDPNLPTAVPSTQPTPVSTRVLAPVTPTITPTITPIPNEVYGTVIDVLSGDTIAVVLKGDKLSRTYLVRYIGLESPPQSELTPWGLVAYEVNRELTRFKAVRLVKDKTDFDKSGYLLRYVYMGDKFINQDLLARGLAKLSPSDPDIAQQSVLAAAEAAARDSSLGLWGPAPTATVIRPRQTPAPGGSPPPPNMSLNLATSTPRLTTTVTATTTVTTP